VVEFGISAWPWCTLNKNAQMCTLNLILQGATLELHSKQWCMGVHTKGLGLHRKKFVVHAHY
jgi:hypothetical protein